MPGFTSAALSICRSAMRTNRGTARCRSPFRLLASLGLQRTLGETSSLYQAAHASQCRPKLERQMSIKVKTTPCFSLPKDSGRRQPDSTAPIARLGRRHALHTSDVDSRQDRPAETPRRGRLSRRESRPLSHDDAAPGDGTEGTPLLHEDPASSSPALARRYASA